MLASITPLGERGRHSRYAITMGAFVLSAVLAGAGAGLVLGALGSLLLSGLSTPARLIVLSVALLAAIIIDLRPGSAPGPRRQVNEQWLDRYRGWVYGLGFGAQLGLGVSTIVTSAATYVALLAACLSADPLAGAVIVGVYGTVRGLTPLLAVGTRTPGQLVSLHSKLASSDQPVARGSLVALGAALFLALAGAVA